MFLRNKYWFFLSIFCCCCVCSQCNKEEPVVEMPNIIEQDFPIVYAADLPAGKLPFPHQNPDLSQNEYASLVDDLFIINNFGLYQCGEEKEECYFHDGLDFVLENGTPIFALEDGIVQANIGGNSFYRILVIEDKDKPGYAWSYTHVYEFAVALNEEVVQGQYLARVNFDGLEHIHLSRTRLKEGGSWNVFEDLINIYPDDYFIFKDVTSPTVKTPFHYFHNTSDSLLVSEGETDTISGKVDIVVSMRDGGAYANDIIGNSGLWGNRLAVRDISYQIIKNGDVLLARPSFDFTKLEFVFHREKWREAMTIFKHHTVLDQDAGDNNMFHSHYIITNARDDLAGQIEPEEEENAWDTLELTDTGIPKYPNGHYQVMVTVHDSNGNETIKSSEVYVNN